MLLLPIDDFTLHFIANVLIILPIWLIFEWLFSAHGHWIVQPRRDGPRVTATSATVQLAWRKGCRIWTLSGQLLPPPKAVRADLTALISSLLNRENHGWYVCSLSLFKQFLWVVIALNFKPSMLFTARPPLQCCPEVVGSGSCRVSGAERCRWAYQSAVAISFVVVLYIYLFFF